MLCSRLLAIEYIDLAEQSLQALEKLSHEHPQVFQLPMPVHPFKQILVLCHIGERWQY